MKVAQEISNKTLFEPRFVDIPPFEGKWEIDQDQNSIKLAESFFRNPQYQKVYLNFDYSQSYHVWIGEGNYEYKQVGYMRMLSFPYKEFKFNIGDYITCIYDNKETTWIIKTITKNHAYDCIAHIEKTNNYLKWVDDFGNLQQYRCVVSDKILEAFPGRSDIVHPEGNIFVDVRRDLTTSKIVENQKFIFGGIAPNIVQGQIYKVYAFKNFMNDEETNEAILSLELRRENADEMDEDQSKDDLYNNIPDIYNMKTYTMKLDSNDITQSIGYKTKLKATVYKEQDKTNYEVIWESSQPSVATIDSNGNLEIVGYGTTVITARFKNNTNVYDSITVNATATLPGVQYYEMNPLNVDIILQGDEQVFSIYHYTDNVPDAETFKIEFSGVPNSDKYKGYFYDVEAVGGNIDNCNEFKITNNRAFNQGKLKIEAISNISGNVVSTINIRLGGLV